MFTVRTAAELKILVLLFLSFTLPAFSQEPSTAQPAAFLHSNDKFGMNLMNEVYKGAPDRNIAIAPLPVSFTFAALRYGSIDAQNIKEVDSVFQFQGIYSNDIAARMLLVRFEKPKPSPRANPAAPKADQQPTSPNQELWFSTALLYRGPGSLSQDFMDRATSNYGVVFRAVGDDTPDSEILAQNWDSSLPLPVVVGPTDFSIASFLHLRTSWAGNTFATAKRERYDFTLASGRVVQADFLKSETKSYFYSHTDEYDAIVLNGQEASILLVLPAQSTSVGALLASLAGDPDRVQSSLKRRQGDVLMPPFHVFYKTDLRAPLEKMGVKRIFQSPDALFSMAPTRGGAKLTAVAQVSVVTVDEHGMRADASTGFGGIFGGIEMIGNAPFHLVLNRPFLFVIRDSVTNCLLFTGVVVDPTTP